jgi:paraquat-inducible protein B
MLVLLSIILITLGPSVIDSNTTNCDELKTTVSNQREQINKSNEDISELIVKVRGLQKQIIDNQQECTDNIIERERQIYYEIERLKRRMNSVSTQNRVVIDTISEIPSPLIIDDNMDLMMEGLNKIQRNIQQDINRKKD